MAKKVVATLKSGKGKDFTKVIKMVKSPKTGSYSFKEEIVHNDHIQDFLKSAVCSRHFLNNLGEKCNRHQFLLLHFQVTI